MAARDLGNQNSYDLNLSREEKFDGATPKDWLFLIGGLVAYLGCYLALTIECDLSGTTAIIVALALALLGITCLARYRIEAYNLIFLILSDVMEPLSQLR